MLLVYHHLIIYLIILEMAYCTSHPGFHQPFEVGMLFKTERLRELEQLSYSFLISDITLSGITHIVRGEDHVTNTASQIQMFEALGGKVPVFAHVIHGMDDFANSMVPLFKVFVCSG